MNCNNLYIHFVTLLRSKTCENKLLSTNLQTSIITTLLHHLATKQFKYILIADELLVIVFRIFHIYYLLLIYSKCYDFNNSMFVFCSFHTNGNKGLNIYKGLFLQR